eukprot:TRINITY_DN9597_c1_g1_i1.p1 TRINITY_DN9597_c1_g1~~TRINITY_DN9597_c1_g1_i1.p1  ORF type:complete len:327 (-),score=64.39 TRINITY_DN9597_c1_g1_i1:44-1024(-)
MYLLHLANVPFCAWIRRRMRKFPSTVGCNKHADLKFIFPFVLNFAAFAMLVGLTEANNSWIVLQLIVYCLAVIMVIFWKRLKDKNLTWLMFLVTVIPSIPMSVYKPSNSQNVIPLAVGFFNLFYVQGFLDQVFQDDHRLFLTRSSWVTSPVVTFIVLLFAILGVACAQEKVYMFMIYPFYQIPMNRVLLVSGSWAWVTIIHRFALTFYDQAFDAKAWKSIKFQHVTFTMFFIHKFITDLLLGLWIAPAKPREHAIYFAIVLFLLSLLSVVFCIIHSLWVNRRQILETICGCRLVGGSRDSVQFLKRDSINSEGFQERDTSIGNAAL